MKLKQWKILRTTFFKKSDSINLMIQLSQVRLIHEYI